MFPYRGKTDADCFWDLEVIESSARRPVSGLRLKTLHCQSPDGQQ